MARALQPSWNILGLLDLGVAVTTGFITSPSALFSYEPPNELIAIFPLVLIPVYLVPLSVMLHLASLAKLHGWLAYRRKIAKFIPMSDSTEAGGRSPSLKQFSNARHKAVDTTP